MSKRTIGIIVASILGFIGLAVLLSRRKVEDGDISGGAGAGCVKIKPGKFPAWQDANVPGGELNKLSREYFPNRDPGPTGSIVGGFFKAIDTYPSSGAAQYYAAQMKKWVPSSEGLPYWQVLQGELLCPA